ncbi:YdeI/OmpD-associated family protein [Rathayibacter sp. KR2-224]|uniref:YdeI/OmpD-associated family protein n=1 Tax=Rathayibacter sp. KR2-224 TaxID=3400913 RepID=UPI003C090EEC
MAVRRPVLRLPDQSAWRSWLEQNHEGNDGVQLALAKGGTAGITYAEALDEALCFGWIDGQKQGLSDTEWLQTFTPRRQRSIWSKRNREHIERLEREGRMTQAGRAEVERAKADGRWDAAYAGSRDIGVPDDLAAALAASPKASSMFETLTSQNRFAILFRIGNVKRAETRERKIREYVAMLERGDTIYKQLRRES